MQHLLSPAQFKKISSLAEERWGLHLPDSKRTLVAGRMTKLARRTAGGSIDDLIARLDEKATDEDMLEFFDALATNTTSFFRESQHFDYLAEELYPAIRATGQRTIRVWSAASSIGAEPYTLAVHLHEHFNGLEGYDAKILATDLASKAVNRSKEGVYSEKEIEGMPRQLRVKYFDEQAEKRYSVKEALRNMVSVHRLNLLEPWPMRGPFDAIFLRNVMIYFDAPVRERLVNRMAKLLAPHGVLVIGSAETLAGLNTPYETVRPAVYRPGGAHA